VQAATLAGRGRSLPLQCIAECEKLALRSSPSR